MKGLAIYSLGIQSIGTVALLIDAIQGVDVESNLWAVCFTIPVIVFLILFLKNYEKKI